MENGHWWEAYKNRWTVDAGRNVIIGQCEPEEEKATRGFMNKHADTVFYRQHAAMLVKTWSPLAAFRPSGKQRRVGKLQATYCCSEYPGLHQSNKVSRLYYVFLSHTVCVSVLHTWF